MSHAKVAIREDLVIIKQKHNCPTICKDTFFLRVVIVSTIEILSLSKSSVNFCFCCSWAHEFLLGGSCNIRYKHHLDYCS